MVNEQLEAQGMQKQKKCCCIKHIFFDVAWGEDTALGEGRVHLTCHVGGLVCILVHITTSKEDLLYGS